MPPAECPASETVASFLDGTLARPARERLEAHAVGCDACFHLLCDASQLLLGYESSSPAFSLDES